MKALLKKSLLPLGLLFTIAAGGASAVQLSQPAEAWWWYNPYQYCGGAACAQPDDCVGTGVWCWCEESTGLCRE